MVEDQAGNKAIHTQLSQATNTDNTPPTAGGGAATTITTTDVTETGLTLSWNKASDDLTAQENITYSIYYSTSSMGNNVTSVEGGTAFGTAEANIDTKQITGLTYNTTYYFNIVVEDQAGNKAIYTEIDTTTSNDVTPPLPGNSGIITATNITNNSLTLSWTAASDNISDSQNIVYEVRRSTSSNLNTVNEAKTYGIVDQAYTHDTTSFGELGLTPSVTYYFNVIIRDEALNESIYTMVSATAVPQAPPNQPTDFTIEVNSDTTMTLNWSTGGGTTAGFYLSSDIGSSAPGDCSSPSVSLGFVSSYQITDLSPSTEYSFRLCSRNQNQPPDYSAGVTATATTLSTTILPYDPNPILVVAGKHHTCSLNTDRGVWCWGKNEHKQTGWGSAGSLSPMISTAQLYLKKALLGSGSGLDNFSTLSLGDRHSCGIKTDGHAWCWGGNLFGQLGDNTSGHDEKKTSPTAVADNHKFRHISVGSYHSCALQVDGTSLCWGKNDNGQLGDGTNISKSTPTLVSGGHKFVVLADISGSYSTCGIKVDGLAYCWGHNLQGQLGDNSTEMKMTPTAVAENHKFSQIAMGYAHTCGLKADGSAYCWGDNPSGQLGIGDRYDKLIPKPVTGSHLFASLALGDSHSCGLKNDGSVFCWGDNTYGALGNGTSGPNVVSTVPIPITSYRKFKQITAGNHTCGLDVSGDIYCWGENDFAQLGNITTDNSSIPKRYKSPMYELLLGLEYTDGKATNGLHSIGNGSPSRHHSCGLNNDGAAYCWGLNSDGQLGDGTSGSTSSIPSLVAGDHVFSAISEGYNHTCAMKSDGSVFCWGSGASGSLGDGSNSSLATVPGPVLGGHVFTDITLGHAYSCSLKVDGSAFCWGNNTRGQLGINSTINQTSPIEVNGDHAFASIDLGYQHSCGVEVNGTTFCWGSNSSGQLGDNTTNDQLVPTQIFGSDLFTSISLGAQHTCGLQIEGSIMCWGNNDNQQLGLGTENLPNSQSPVSVNHEDLQFVSVSVGNTHTCGLTALGLPMCWGSNSYGQVGDNSSDTDRFNPQAVSGFPRFTQLSLGQDFSCGLKGDGTALCWGYNFNGQLGNNTTLNRLTPTQVAQPGTCDFLAEGGTWQEISGDVDYLTADFCVMKYEAKNAGGQPSSNPEEIPWVNISQTDSITECQSLGTNYDLISNNRWMTMAYNITNVVQNWSGYEDGDWLHIDQADPVVGSLNRGHSDGTPNQALAADSNDNNACSGTGQSCDANTWNLQRRTHLLSNGGVVWDVSANVAEWTSYYNTDGRPNATSYWYEYSDVTTDGAGTKVTDLRPTQAFKDFWNDTWNSSEGIGQYYPDLDVMGGALNRGAHWGHGSYAGIYAAHQGYSQNLTTPKTGFRCAASIIPPSCDGTLVGGHCWYMGNTGESCLATCATHGGYSNATASYAGESGTSANCNAVLDALGQPGSETSDGSSSSGLGLGCIVYDSASRWRITSDPTTPDASLGSHARACACFQ